MSGKRGPLHIEPAISALHSLSGIDGLLSFEIGSYQGKICFFVRATLHALPLIESQLYAQYPDIDIERLRVEDLNPSADEVMYSAELGLLNHEIYPFKRHPQFDDLLARQTLDPIAGITSTLVRYPHPAMRGHIQIILRPLPSSYRKRVLKFLPLMQKGFSAKFDWYQSLFTRVHLARGFSWWLCLPLNILLGGFRAWFHFLPRTEDLFLGSTSPATDQDADDSYQSARRSHESEDPITAVVDKANRLLFEASVKISVISPRVSASFAQQKISEIASSFRQFTLPNCNGFSLQSSSQATDLSLHLSSSSLVFSVEEVATLWHFPNALVQTPNIDWVFSKKLEPPVDLPLADGSPDLTILGESVFRGHRTQFGIRPDDRRRHMYIIGKTGMGKSTLLENMIYSDVLAGKGVAVIDPHGDLIQAVLRFIPASRTNDVILFDPADREYPIAFNMLSSKNPHQHSLVVSGLMSVFTKLWPDVWSGRMEHILRSTLLALIEGQNNSMLGILRMLSDDLFRKKIVDHLTDHHVKSFWEDEFATWSEKYRTEAIAAIQNKIGQLLSVPIIRNIVGQVTSKLNLREAMDTSKIVLVNLSKGTIGEDNSAFLGSMLVTKFQLDAMSRADIPEKDRRDFYLYVDEFQNFATESFATILSEARKYRLNLTLAHQYIGQLIIGGSNTALRDAVFGNVGSMTSFQVGSDDAEVLSQQFEEMVGENDILSLPKYHAYMRLMVGGMASKPFSVSTLPPPAVAQDEDRLAIIRRASRERYCEKRVDVEEKISQWLQSAKEAKKTVVVAEKAKEKESEEREKAKKKGMKLDEYRAWRDRELWMNEYNALRKKKYLEGGLTPEEDQKMLDLMPKLEATGGVPPPSKAMLDLLTKKGIVIDDQQNNVSE